MKGLKLVVDKSKVMAFECGWTTEKNENTGRYEAKRTTVRKGANNPKFWKNKSGAQSYAEVQNNRKMSKNWPISKVAHCNN